MPPELRMPKCSHQLESYNKVNSGGLQENDGNGLDLSGSEEVSMTAINRLLMRFLPALVFCMSAGCGDYYVTELKTRDDRIHIVIKERGLP